MLDTNICIYIIKRKPPQVFKRFRSFKLGDIGISSITLAELHYGIRKSQKSEQNKIALNHFLMPLEISFFDDAAALKYGEIRAYLEKQGKIIGSMDMLIASHAKSLDVPLITNNKREFKRVPDLKIENWVS